MPLPEPTFDSRTYREILSEALARVPAHTPEWTHLSDSDPGVTLLGLFAFMTESLMYRANRIPVHNRKKFLRLLGVPLRAAEPAVGLVSFSNPRGRLETITLDADREVLAGRVPFRTRRGLHVLPIEARIYYKSPLNGRRRAEVEALYRRLYASFEATGQTTTYYQTRTFITPRSGVTLPALDLTPSGQLAEAPDATEPFGDRDAGPETAAATLDGAIWLALLARPREDPDEARQAIAHRVLSLGVLPALDAEGCVIPPGGSSSSAGDNGLVFELPDVSRATASYRRLTPRGGGDLLARPGIVELPLPGATELRTWDDLEPLVAGTGDYPPALEESEDRERLITWLRIRRPRATADAGTVASGLSARLSWVGINAAEVVQRTEIVGEPLPRGTGEPDQIATLINTPVLVDSVRLTVGGELWQRIDELSAAAPEVPPRGPRMASELSPSGAAAVAAPIKVYTVDRESGEIRFGDGARGMRPPAGAVIQASYAYGGGRQGMVAIGAINKGPALDSGVAVTNAVPTWGGDEGETIAEAEKAIPGTLRHCDRLISAEDVADVTARTPGVDLGRVEVLPLFHPALGEAPAAGVVTVMVIPRHDPERPDAPRPDRLFLETVCRHLEPRRLLTTELHVQGPEYTEVWVSVGLEVIPGRAVAPVLERARQAIESFLSPLTGGFEGRGWPLGKVIEVEEIAAAVTRVDGVAKVAGKHLGDADGNPVDQVVLSGLQLPRLVAVAIEAGDAPTIEELRSGGAAGDGSGGEGGDGALVVPVPVIPEEC